LPEDPKLIEVNFVGMDPRIEDPGDTYVLDDSELPLLVFGTLSLLKSGRVIEVESLRIPVPRTAGLVLEKLITDRSGEKGNRDLLVVLGLLLVADESDVGELMSSYQALPADLRYAARSNLTVLSLMEPIAGMPDPQPHRARIADLLRRLETGEQDDR
jgi:hypothetical protein